MNKKQISELLSRIGISPAYKGYPYLVHVIHLTTDKEGCPFLVIKELYARTADFFGVSATSIQHSIRTLLDVYWSQNNTKYFFDIIGYPVHDTLPPKEFIAVIADYIKRKDE